MRGITGPSSEIPAAPSYTSQPCVYNSALMHMAAWSQELLEPLDCGRAAEGETSSTQL